MTQSSIASRHDGFTPERQAVFIEALAATGSVAAAAGMAGISRTAVYNLRNRMDEAGAGFRAAWDARVNEVVAVLADAVVDRALNGVEETVYYNGEPIGTRIRHNDRLLMFLLKALDPQTYARRPAVVDGMASLSGMPAALAPATPGYRRPHASGSSVRSDPAYVSTLSSGAGEANPASVSTSSTAGVRAAPVHTPSSPADTGRLAEELEERFRQDAPAASVGKRQPGQSRGAPVLSKRNARRIAARQKRQASLSGKLAGTAQPGEGRGATPPA